MATHVYRNNGDYFYKKEKAQQRAKKLRDMGFLVRIKKDKELYELYTCRKG